MSRHITSGLPHQAEQLIGKQAAEQESAVRKQPPEPDAHPFAGSRRPDYVIELWVSKELRDRVKRNNAALAQERQDHGGWRHCGEAEPDAELEAEP